MNTSKNNILVVDDEPDIRELIEYYLRKEGYHVTTAVNGKQAITMAKREIQDLIILDIMMPEMDGIEACRLMRSEERRVGKECVSTCRSRWSRDNKKKKKRVIKKSKKRRKH